MGYFGIFFDTVFLDTVALLCLAAALFYYYCTSNNNYWKRKDVPFIEPTFFFGNIKDILTFKESQPEVLSKFYHHFKDLGYGYGGIFQLRDPVLMVCSPALVKDICIKNFPAFHDRGLTYDENFDPLSAHLVLLDGQKWKYLRAKLTPTFTTGKLRSMFPTVAEAANIYMEVLEKLSKSGEECEFREINAQFATDVIGSCVFGLQFNSLQDENSEFRAMGRKVFTPSKWEKITQNLRNIYPWMYKLFRFRLVNDEITNFFISSVKSTMEQRVKNNVQRNDFIQLLMQLRHTKVTTVKNLDGGELTGIKNYDASVQEGAIELTDEVLAAQAFVFFLAGFETSSTTMSFCLQEIASRVDIQDRLAEEAEAVKEKFGDFTYEALNELKYMEQVIDETLRMYPPATILLRNCTQRYRIPDTDVVIEPGTRVFIPTWSFHRDPDLFPEPDQFNPDRWSEENKPNIDPHSYMPFGIGPRICIGLRFAMMEMKLALANMMCKYQVLPCSKTKPFQIDPRAFILAPQNGVWLRVVKRPNKPDN